MNNLLLEEISRFRILTGYNPEFTYSENYSFLEEQRQFGRQLVGYSDDALRQVASQAKQLPMFKGMADDAVEGFFKAVQQNKGNTKQIMQFQDELLKSGIKGGQLGGLADAAVDGYVKQLLNSSESIATQFKGASKADRIAMLKNANYPETTINAIIKKTDDLTAATKQAGNVAQDAASAGKTATQQGTKTVADTGKRNIVGKGIDLARKYKDKLVNSLKTSGWKKALAVAAGLGVGGAALWMLAKENNTTTSDMPTEKPVDNSGSAVTPSVTGGSAAIPTELGDVEGVKKFQSWLDANRPGWHQKYNTLGDNVARGWGKFGPNTQRAWNNEEIKNAYLNQGGTGGGEIENPTTQPVQQVTNNTGERPDLNSPRNAPTNLKGVSTQPNITPEQYYNQLVSGGFIDSIAQGGNRIVYRGPRIDNNVENYVDQYLSSQGYTKVRERDPQNRDKEVTVWKK